MKVLVVDDSKTIRLVIGKTLKQMGHEVLEAANGKEAVTSLAANRDVGLALVDWNMPEMNGYEFVVATRQDPASKTLPIMMVTTEAEIANMQKAVAAGANEFIVKPFTAQALQEKMALLGIK